METAALLFITDTIERFLVTLIDFNHHDITH